MLDESRAHHSFAVGEAGGARRRPPPRPAAIGRRALQRRGDDPRARAPERRCASRPSGAADSTSERAFHDVEWCAGALQQNFSLWEIAFLIAEYW